MKGYLAFNLTESARAKLLSLVPPTCEKVVAHHVTYKFGVDEAVSIPLVNSVKVIGISQNQFIQCVVVEVDGTHQRDDGKVYHITISHQLGRKPVESNDCITENHWKNLTPFDLDVIPRFNKF